MILLTGASGFLGTNLTTYLVQKGLEVKDLALRKKDWETTFCEGINTIVHCAGKAHDHKGEATEQDFFDVNYTLTTKVFDYFLKSDAKLFIHISSIAAVEEESSDKVLTEDVPSNSFSYYGKSKKKTEEYLLKYDLPAEKKLIILRPTMIHGPGDKGNLMLLFKIINKGIPYPLGSFDNKRSFIGVDNLCYIIERIVSNSTVQSGVYNVTDDEPLSTLEIIKVIGNVTGKKAKVLFFPKKIISIVARAGSILKLPLNTKRLNKMTSNLEVSNQKIKNALKIKKMPLTASEGLEKTIKSFIK